MNKVIAISIVKDEEDIVTATVGNMCNQADVVVVLDNMSTDTTRRKLWDLVVQKGNLYVGLDDEEAYYQARKMSELARTSIANHGEVGDWIVPFDADEMWMGVSGLRDLADEVQAVRFPGVDYRVTRSSETQYDCSPVDYMTWHEPMNTGFEPKVAFRYVEGAQIQQGNHAVFCEGAWPSFIIQPEMYIAHYPIRSVKHFLKKAHNGGAAYRAATDLPLDWGSHWRRWGEMTDEELRDEFYHKFFYEDPAAAGLTYNPIVP